MLTQQQQVFGRLLKKEIVNSAAGEIQSLARFPISLHFTCFLSLPPEVLTLQCSFQAAFLAM